MGCNRGSIREFFSPKNQRLDPPKTEGFDSVFCRVLLGNQALEIPADS